MKNKYLFLILCPLSFMSQNLDSLYQRKWIGFEDSIKISGNKNLKPIISTPPTPTPVLPLKDVKSDMILPAEVLPTAQQKKWFLYGQNTLQFNQSAFSNWISGGQNNIGILGKIYYNLTYREDKQFWENSLQAGYGLVSTQGQSSRKTEDIWRWQSNYGYHIGGDYFLSAGLQLMSQFTDGYDYNKTPDPVHEDRISSFMAPGYMNLGVGVSYQPNENFQVIFRPVNGKFTFVLDPELQRAGMYGLERDGQSLRKELGAMASIQHRWDFMERANLTHQLILFTNYLQHMERVDISYNAQVNLKFNKWLTTNIGVDVVYDHDQITRTQFKQVLGVGATYNFGWENKEKDKRFIKPFFN